MAKWIWNYGDYEIYHVNEVLSRRQEFGADYPPFWNLYAPTPKVKFCRKFTCTTDGSMTLHVNGMGYILIDWVRYPADKKAEVKAGEHYVEVVIMNTSGLPCAFIESDVCPSDENWYTYDYDGKHIPAGTHEKYNSLSITPETFLFSYEHMEPVSVTERDNGLLYDFGKELFGYLYIDNANPSDSMHVSYGETIEEAVDTEYSLLFEDVSGNSSYKLVQRAFRYIYITGSSAAISVHADYEYLPLEYKGNFECDVEDVNKIWDMCAYTLHLNTREVFLDGIKRDRWIWSGDAYQCFKFNNYIFFDKDIVTRTLIALRGKEPFYEHINTITDYSLYWVISLYDFYTSFADVDFIKIIYPRAVSLMDFCTTRLNSEGFIVGQEIDYGFKDWVFIDWSDIDKTGAVSALQMLLIEANRSMAKLAKLIGEPYEKYEKTADELVEKVNKFFWNEEKGAFIDSYESGKENVTRHSNIFAIMYDIATESQKEKIMQNVLLNDNITKITTPYFEGYELDVMGKCGNFKYIEDMLISYWKGMLDLGATAVWEEYNPANSGLEHYGAYDNKYGLSLCHAWGASPIYLLGKYYLGVTPTSPGYETFEVKPYLGRFGHIKGTVPINGGSVKIDLTNERLSVIADKDGGTLIFGGNTYPIIANEELVID